MENVSATDQISPGSTESQTGSEFEAALLQQLTDALLLGIVSPLLLDQLSRQQETYNEIRRENQSLEN